MPAVVSPASLILGGRIRALRKEIRISQLDLAELAEVHFTNLGKIERGVANPSLSTIVRIAAALNVDPAVLVAGIGSSDLPKAVHQITAADLIKARNEQLKEQQATEQTVGSIPESHIDEHGTQR